MRHFILPVLLILEVAVFLPYSGIRFDSWETFGNSAVVYAADVFAPAAPLLLLAFGMTIVLMTAGIDLSVGSMTVLVACSMSTFEGEAGFWYTAMPVGLILGLALGLFNGFLIARLDVPAIIATLGTLFFYRGLCDAIMRGEEGAVFFSVPGYDWFGGTAGSMALVAGLYLLGGSYFQFSRWRREILMLGGNRIAARYAGIPVGRRTYQVYGLMGLLSFVAAVCLTSRHGSISASSELSLELQVIVAVVLGGTRVEGGGGSVVGSFWGVLLIVVLETGLQGAALTELRNVLLGGLLAGGVWLNARFSPAARTAQA